MKMWNREVSVALAATILLAGEPAVAGQDNPTPSKVAPSWEARIAKAESVKRGTKGEPSVPKNVILLKLDVSFRYVGADSSVSAPVIKVRDAGRKEWPALSETKHGQDPKCFTWLLMSAFYALGLKPQMVPRQTVESCQTGEFVFYFALPDSARPPFELSFADAEPVVVNLN